MAKGALQVAAQRAKVPLQRACKPLIRLGQEVSRFAELSSKINVPHPFPNLGVVGSNPTEIANT